MQYGGEGYLPWSWGEMRTEFGATDLMQIVSVKPQDHVPPWSYGSQRCNWTFEGMRDTVKRSYKRACRRAANDGYAWYRGSHIPFDAFPTAMQKNILKDSMQKARPKKTEHPRTSPRSRLNVMHTNVGGLAATRLEEITQWAQTKDIDVLILSETRWRFSSEWDVAKWNCIHSGTESDISDGILIMVRKHVCNATNIGITEYIPGRLVHLRFHYTSRAFDLISCYQYVDNRSLKNKHLRQHFWAQLQQCMGTVPNRNSLLLAGDFNCSLHADGQHVGTDKFRWHCSSRSGTKHADAGTFHDFLRRYNLTVLNSWDARSPPTFCHGYVASRIDYLIMRHADSDCYSKQVTYHQDADFLPLDGPMHIPMVCSVKKIPFIFTKAAGRPTCTYQQRMHCRAAWRHQNPTWITMMHDLETQIFYFQSTHHCDYTYIDDLHNTLMPTLQQHFPKIQRNPKHPVNSALIDSKWMHRRRLLSLDDPTLLNMYKAWYHYAKFRQLKKQHLNLAKDMKKQQKQDLLREVDQAAAIFDSFRVFQIINRYTPKQPTKKIRLRTEDGAPATSIDVRRLTQDFITTRWDGPNELFMTVEPLNSLPFTVEDLAAEIARTPAVKSVASHCLPGVILKNLSTTVAALLHAKLTTWWTQGTIFVPEQWRHAWIAFLPKPNKVPSKLEHLRAIALMEPLGKMVLGLITKQFKDAIHPIVTAWPQFAYISYRSAGDAIRRVAHHCNLTRTLLRNQLRTVHQRAANSVKYPICGGIQMFIDISRAFDEIPRQPLFNHLRTLNIRQDLVTLLGKWHSDTAYITTHDGDFVHSPTKCGIRQGCRAAPVLWTGFTNLIFEELSKEIDPHWIRQAVTIYADDIHSGDTFYSAEALHHILKKFGILLDVLEKHGLTISIAKSVLIISFGGTNYRRLQQHLVQRGEQGFYVCIPRAGGRHSKLPVQKMTTYLGVQMSYTSFEAQTLTHRMTAAKTTFCRLRRWLRSRQLMQKTKLHLWHSCIYTTLIYGLFATNLTFTGFYKLNTFIMHNLHQVLGDHSFQSGLTHAQFLIQYQLQHPFAMLMHSIAQLRRLHCRRLIHLTPQDILHTVDWTNLESLEAILQTAWDAQDQHMNQLLPMHEEVPIQYFACQWCQLRFDSLPNLRRHLTQIHGHTQLRTHQITIASYSLHGLPQCTNCHKMFSTWRSFSIHLERNCCQAMPRATSSTVPGSQQDTTHQWLTSADLSLLLSKPYGSALLQAVRDGQWAPLRAMTQAHRDLQNYCILCGVYHGRPQELNMHIRTQHRQYVANIFAKAAQFGRAQASISPCFFCEKTFVRQHQCVFWTQIALLVVNLPPAGDSDDSTRLLRCEICRCQYETLQALHSHLFSEHKVEIQDWLPTRDLLGADPVCAHTVSVALHPALMSGCTSPEDSAHSSMRPSRMKKCRYPQLGHTSSKLETWML